MAVTISQTCTKLTCENTTVSDVDCMELLQMGYNFIFNIRVKTWQLY